MLHLCTLQINLKNPCLSFTSVIRKTLSRLISTCFSLFSQSSCFVIQDLNFSVIRSTLSKWAVSVVLTRAPFPFDFSIPCLGRDTSVFDGASLTGDLFRFSTEFVNFSRTCLSPARTFSLSGLFIKIPRNYSLLSKMAILSFTKEKAFSISPSCLRLTTESYVS